MPITLVSGLPGHGKTLYSIDRLRKEYAGRKIYYHGIKGLALDWEPLADPKQWPDAETGALIIIDEAWEVFPMRQTGSPVPAYVQALATHRHKGHDIWLITQHPMQLDTFVRRLIDHHIHVQRTFGMNRATVHLFRGLKSDPEKTREGSERTEWTYPADVFNIYKSAEVHTVKRRIPVRLYLLGIIPILAGLMLWATVEYLSPDSVTERVAKAAPTLATTDTPSLQPAAPGAPGGGVIEYTRPMDWEEQHRPRIAELPHTAPIFDALTQPVVAPVPRFCVASETRCTCYTGQSTPLPVNDGQCRTWARDGLFDPYGKDPSLPNQNPQSPPAAA